MRFKIDENLPKESKALLTRANHDAVTVNDERMGGGSDPDLAAVCKSEGRVIVTLDLDFADIRTYRPAEHPGIVVLRPMRQAKSHVLKLLQLVIERLAGEELAGRLWVVDEGSVRIRESD
jgi:predicted nuclease of predicted toxin-antitoxin system